MTAELFFQIYGVLFGVLGLGLVLHPQHYTKVMQEIAKNEGFILAGGIIALLWGTVVLHFQNAWEWNILLPITIFGWLGVLKGAFLIMCPKGVEKMTTFMLKCKYFVTIAGAVAILMSAGCVYIGFFA
ncbi:MAG: hypothetical protein WCJ84_00180 [Candidatus Peregrinibacteria bacterium]